MYQSSTERSHLVFKGFPLAWGVAVQLDIFYVKQHCLKPVEKECDYPKLEIMYLHSVIPTIPLAFRFNMFAPNILLSATFSQKDWM